MAHPLAIDRKPRVVGRKPVTDEGGAPCCCEPAPGLCCDRITVRACADAAPVTCPFGSDYDFVAQRTTRVQQATIPVPTDYTDSVFIRVRARCVNGVRQYTVDPASFYRVTGTGHPPVNLTGQAAFSRTFSNPIDTGWIPANIPMVGAGLPGGFAFSHIDRRLYPTFDSIRTCVGTFTLFDPGLFDIRLDRNSTATCTGGGHYEKLASQQGTGPVLTWEGTGTWTVTTLSACPPLPLTDPTAGGLLDQALAQ